MADGYPAYGATVMGIMAVAGHDQTSFRASPYISSASGLVMSALALPYLVTGPVRRSIY